MLQFLITFLETLRSTEWGPSDNRPKKLGVKDTGFIYFDTSLGIPIWWNGHNWISHDGTKR